MVSWRDYEGADGFGGISGPAEMDALNKALSAGSSVNAPGSAVPGDGFALRVESLERTLKSVTFRMEHIRLWKAIPKLPAYNTVEEHNQLTAYGNGDEAFVAAGELPGEEDSTYERKYATIKYLGTTRRIEHPMTLVRSANGNAVAQEQMNGTLHLLRIVETQLFKGDSSLSSVQFDGFAKLIEDNAPAANIIDMRGLPMTESKMLDGGLTIQDAPNYGTPTHMHCNPKVKADIIKAFYPKERYDAFKSEGGQIGIDVNGFMSPAGPVKFEPNVFITDGGAPSAASGNVARRPNTPTVSTAATSPTEATALFGADDAGTYNYKVSAHNKYGKSASLDVGTVTVAAGDKVTFGVLPAGGADVEWYQVYRTLVGGAAGEERLILRVPNTGGAGEMVLDDLNESLPFCTNVYLWQQNLECMSWKQLAPLIKIPLATIDPSVRFMMLLYGVPVLYTPGKCVLYKNVGRAAGYVGQP